MKCRFGGISRIPTLASGAGIRGKAALHPLTACVALPQSLCRLLGGIHRRPICLMRFFILKDFQDCLIPSLRSRKLTEPGSGHPGQKPWTRGRLDHSRNIYCPEESDIIEPVSQPDRGNFAEGSIVEVSEKTHTVRFFIRAQDMIETAATRPSPFSTFDAGEQLFRPRIKDLKRLIIFTLFGENSLIHREPATQTDFLNTHVVKADHTALAFG
jgi:hypothetical protein